MHTQGDFSASNLAVFMHNHTELLLNLVNFISRFTFTSVRAVCLTTSPVVVYQCDFFELGEGIFSDQPKLTLWLTFDPDQQEVRERHLLGDEVSEADFQNGEDLRFVADNLAIELMFDPDWEDDNWPDDLNFL